MSGKFDSSKGSVRIANSVIAKIAGYAATSCYGVVGMAVKSSKDGIARLLKRDQMDRGVKVKVAGNGIDITLYIISEYGTGMATIGELIKNNVKYNVEQMTGINVNKVNVNIEGIRVN